MNFSNSITPNFQKRKKREFFLSSSNGGRSNSPTENILVVNDNIPTSGIILDTQETLINSEENSIKSAQQNNAQNTKIRLKQQRQTVSVFTKPQRKWAAARYSQSIKIFPSNLDQLYPQTPQSSERKELQPKTMQSSNFAREKKQFDIFLNSNGIEEIQDTKSKQQESELENKTKKQRLSQELTPKLDILYQKITKQLDSFINHSICFIVVSIILIGIITFLLYMTTQLIVEYDDKQYKVNGQIVEKEYIILELIAYIVILWGWIMTFLGGIKGKLYKNKIQRLKQSIFLILGSLIPQIIGIGLQIFNLANMKRSSYIVIMSSELVLNVLVIYFKTVYIIIQGRSLIKNIQCYDSEIKKNIEYCFFERYQVDKEQE